MTVELNEPSDRAARDRVSGSHVRRASAVERFAGPALLLVMFVGFSIAMPSTFLTYNNLIAVVNNQTITAIIALGLLLPLAAGVFDISIGGMMTLSVVCVAAFFKATAGGMPVPVAIALTLLVAVVGGLINAFLVVNLKIEPFIVTLATGSIFLGLSQLIAGGKVIVEDIPESFTDLGRSKLFGVPLPILYVAVLALALWYLLGHTPFGRQLYATGNGREAARLARVPTNRILYLSFICSATCASLAGLVYVARIGAGQPDVGAQYLLPSYAAAFLGSTMIKPGRFNVVGLLVGIGILAIGINGLQLNGIPSWVIPTFQGGALVVAVVLTKLRSRS